LKAVIDANSGVEVARAFGKVMDEGDVRGLKIATDLGNNIITLDEAETERWKAAAQPTVDQWFADMQAKGVDGKALYEKAKALIAAESGM
jgi:nitrogen fixation protein FixH